MKDTVKELSVLVSILVSNGICVISPVHPAGRLAVLRGKKTVNAGHYTQTVEPNFFIPAMLSSTIDLYHFLPLVMTLTWPGGHKVSAKQNLLASFSPALSIWSGWNVMWRWRNSGWTSWDCLWVRFIETREITAVLQTVSKNFNVGMLSDVFGWVWFKLGVMIDSIVLYTLILV